ncbi:MAG: BrnA antitoxin family protein [Acidobacteria bacterium]|nr:BrnA antitoxin family protein [Acidobacteriota bacterium]
MKKKLKEIRDFKNEDEEREFWGTHDSTDYFDWDNAVVAVFPNLKPSTKTISLRLPVWMLNNLKVAANKRDVPYQSLIKMFLKDRLDAEMKV